MSYAQDKHNKRTGNIPDGPVDAAPRLAPSGLAEQCFTQSCADCIGSITQVALDRLQNQYVMRNYVGFSNRERSTIVCIFGNVTVRFFAEAGIIEEMKTEIGD